MMYQFTHSVRIYPFSVVYEGATLGEHVILEERTTVGSLSRVGARTRIVYQAQVNDKVSIGDRLRDRCFCSGQLRR